MIQHKNRKEIFMQDTEKLEKRKALLQLYNDGFEMFKEVNGKFEDVVDDEFKDEAEYTYKIKSGEVLDIEEYLNNFLNFDTIKVLIVHPGKEAEIKEIKNTLETLQQLVGGYIECFQPYDDEVALIVNEEGKIRSGFYPNRQIFDDNGNLVDVIYGTFIVVGALDGDWEWASLSDEQSKHYADLFNSPFSRIQLKKRS